jgi:hypothetical protein
MKIDKDRLAVAFAVALMYVFYIYGLLQFVLAIYERYIRK